MAKTLGKACGFSANEAIKECKAFQSPP